VAKVIFWEKPGCSGNRRQKEILTASGHELDVRDLLGEPWTVAALKQFFGSRPVPEWFNPAHPEIKAGRFDPEAISAEAALELMVTEPLYIVRPLMQCGDEFLAGFEVSEVHNWIGLALDSVGERDPKNCPCVVKTSA